VEGCDEYGDAFGADGMKAAGVYLTDGFTAAGAVRLPGADIATHLACGGARINGLGEDGYALLADQIKVGGDMSLNAGFTAAGAVRLTGADIGGNLACGAARLNGSDEDGYALLADQVEIGGSMLLEDGFSAAGAVRLPGAAIKGSLIGHRTHLNGRDRDCYALVANEVTVGGSVLLNNQFTAAGAVRLDGAQIARALACDGARIGGQDSGGVALRAGGIQVGSIYLTDEFAADGKIWLRSARLRGSVYLAPKQPAAGVTGLDASNAQIAGTLSWMPTAQVAGEVNLAGAAAGELVDDWGSGRHNGYWPVPGHLHLDGFIYGRFSGSSPASVGQRLAWIRSQFQTGARPGLEPFATQPYEQLAAVYRRAGQDDEARKVAIARRSDQRKYGNLRPHRKVGDWLLDKSIKYGYQTWRAIIGLIILYAAVWGASYFAQQHGLITPVGNITGLHPAPLATKCTSAYPCFYPAGYAIDTVIPIINIHQADFWGPNGNAPWGWTWVAGTWAATGLGWGLATLLVAGYTGIASRQ
jgi:hypothetical protein